MLARGRRPRGAGAADDRAARPARVKTVIFCGILPPMRSKQVEKRRMKPRIPSGAIRGVDNLAVYLQVSRPTVYDWIANHGLPVAHIGGTYVTTTRLIDAWILKTCQLTAELEMGKVEERILAATARRLAELMAALAEDTERRAAARPDTTTRQRSTLTRVDALDAEDAHARGHRGPFGGNPALEAQKQARFEAIRKRYEARLGRRLAPAADSFGKALDPGIPVEPADAPVVAIPPAH